MRFDVAPGEFTAPGAEVLLLADTSTWRIETTGLTELNVAEVAEGAPATITFDALPGVELTGRVSKIDPYGETKQGDIVYTVHMTLDQQHPGLRSNMTAKVRIG
jgi:HlyD family secretion protein